jgi:hypothetical protein
VGDFDQRWVSWQQASLLTGFSAPNEHLLAAKKALADGQTSKADIDAFIDEHQLDLPQPGTH